MQFLPKRSKTILNILQVLESKKPKIGERQNLSWAPMPEGGEP